MSWDFAPAFDAAHRAVLESGKPLVYVCALASWPVVHLFAALPQLSTSGLGTLALVPTTTDAIDLANALQPVSGSRPVHPLTGLVRGERLLRADGIGTLVGTPADILYLLSRSALKSDRVSRIAVVWPEAMDDAGGPGGGLDDLDAVLGDAPRAHRLIVTSDETAGAGGGGSSNDTPDARPLPCIPAYPTEARASFGTPLWNPTRVCMRHGSR